MSATIPVLNKSHLYCTTRAASFTSPTQLFSLDGGETSVAAKNVIIATSLHSPPTVLFKSTRIRSSTGLLHAAPEGAREDGHHLVVESLASRLKKRRFRRQLGAEVEFLGGISGVGTDKEFSSSRNSSPSQMQIPHQGHFRRKRAEWSSSRKNLLRVDKRIPSAGVSVGRRSYAEGLNLEDLASSSSTSNQFQEFVTKQGLKSKLKTKVILWTKKAERSTSRLNMRGICIAAAEFIESGHGHHNCNDVIPSVVSTCPKVAWVPKNGRELEADGVKSDIGQIPFVGQDRPCPARFVKIVNCNRGGDGQNRWSPDHGIDSNIPTLHWEELARTTHAHLTSSNAFLLYQKNKPNKSGLVMIQMYLEHPSDPAPLAFPRFDGR
ncbi:hypothetical protein C8J56DRAFT_1037543 [Mycena floridula]|nr:hypothetical protein C8J56DRAFT_1037543 [Mycena floridula]